MAILIIDNYDSFTHNLLHYVAQVSADEVLVVRNDGISLDDVERFQTIILSPGPGLPSAAGITLEVIKRYHQTHKMLGVCLGHQAIAEAFGGKLTNLREVFHGVSSEISILNKNGIFQGLPEKVEVGRYHSWVIDNQTIPHELMVTSVDETDQIMAIQHRLFPIYGVQFHPESIMSSHGLDMIRNFIHVC